ncbi:hypothetical protein SAMN05880582_10752 [Rhizobium sp. RU20A]|uniref:hypothetical protein n=1 Tax=Rhizobium sp. RU20A TaxID=1907412 RepID=UPI0009565146|nr:hypothetical protein [Rhizobium sp. RU20A]SIR15570.1 hypothetical protein SAMN05880582_10752 [Rhizobium sp. RU20A]
MIDMKNWYESKAVWGGIVAVGASLAGLFGVNLPEGTAHDVTEALTAIAGAVGGLIAVYGRLSADKRLR